MREICMSGSMSGEGKPPVASRSRSSALPRLYRSIRSLLIMILTNCKVSGANSMSDVDYKQVGARDRLIAEQNVGARPSELLVN